jgi:DNA polymerase-3 subunit beta
MKLTISKSTLINALQLITPITDKSSSKPILSNFLLTAGGEGKEGKAEFSATDYEIALKGEFPAAVEEPGTVCISAKKVLEICREFLSEEIRIHSDDQLWVTLEGGAARLRLPSVDIGLYPQLELKDLPNRFSLPAGELKRCIDLTIFAAQTLETRKNLMGVCLKLLDGSSTRWVATDGHRLAQVTRAVDGQVSEAPPEVIIPRKTLVEMQRVLERTTETVEITFDERNLTLSTGSIVLNTRLIEGKFPNVDPVIPKDNDKAVLVDRERMINALKIVSFMSNDKIKPVKLSLEPALLRLESERAEYGDVVDELPVSYEGEAFHIGFNAKYLLDVLSVADQGQNIEMRLKGSLNPCLIQVPEDSGFLSVIMPLRIEW